MTKDAELLSNEDKARVFNDFVKRYETTLQLHALRYDAAERSHEVFSKSAVTLSGGALLIILTTERLKYTSYDHYFAGWFVLGTIAFLIGAFSRFISKRILINSHLTYFPAVPREDFSQNPIKHGTKLFGETSIVFLVVSILMFSIGCGHGFAVMSGNTQESVTE